MIALVSAVLAVPILGVTGSVTGSLTYTETTALTPNAVAIVTIVDQTAAPDAGVVVGQQRIDAPTAVPIDFAVLVDSDTIDPTHSYALFATIVDGAATWQNAVGEPVMTGGPTKGIALVLDAVPTPAALVGGTILPPEATPQSIRGGDRSADQGRDRDAGRPPGATGRRSPDLTFSIGFDPALLDPAATYLSKAGSSMERRSGRTAKASPRSRAERRSGRSNFR